MKSLNIRGLPIDRQPTLRIPVPDIRDLTTHELPAITQPLVQSVPTVKLRAMGAVTQPMPTVDPDATDKQPAFRPLLLCRLEDFAREDGVTPLLFFARMMESEYRRRIARDVEAML